MKKDFFGNPIRVGDYVLYNRVDVNGVNEGNITRLKCKIVKETNCYIFIENSEFYCNPKHLKQIKSYNVFKWNDNVIGWYIDCNGEKVNMKKENKMEKWELENSQIENLVDTYNKCLDKLEDLGYDVGNEYDGHIWIEYHPNSKKKFYIRSIY